MRRLMLMVLSLSFVGVMAGCAPMHTHGVCDCEYDDYCTSRAPWVHGGYGYDHGPGPMIAPAAAPIPNGIPPITVAPSGAIPSEALPAPLKIVPETKKGL